MDVAEPAGSAPERVIATQGRYVPAEVRRVVWRRDEGRCTFADASGRRCHERAGLEIHHEHAFVLGGPTTVENLRLVCRSHNALFAERDFGRAYVERKKSSESGG
jgi:5-methylcytosine-specific restriction endonuclease McrA